MSYILEALQKSEHARHRGKVPDLNTLPETTPSVTGHAATPRPPYLAAGFALALAAAILGWWRPWQATAPQPAAPAPVAKAAENPHQPAAGTQPVPQPAPPPPQAKQDMPAEPSQTTAPTALAAPAAPPAVAPLAAAAPASPPALEPLAPVRPPAAAPEPAKTAAPVARARRDPPASELPAPTAESAPVRRSESASRKSAEPAPPSPSPAPAANRKGSDGRILSIHELPPAVRGSLPRLDISGFAAAPDSGKRMVVINDRLVQEGEEVVPGVTLTSAEKDGVVLDFQGYRFRAQQ